MEVLNEEILKMTKQNISEYLTKKEKEVILKLYTLEGVDIPDIAELIDEPKRIIKDMLYRA